MGWTCQTSQSICVAWQNGYTSNHSWVECSFDGGHNWQLTNDWQSTDYRALFDTILVSHDFGKELCISRSKRPTLQHTDNVTCSNDGGQTWPHMYNASRDAILPGMPPADHYDMGSAGNICFFRSQFVAGRHALACTSNFGLKWVHPLAHIANVSLHSVGFNGPQSACAIGVLGHTSTVLLACTVNAWSSAMETQLHVPDNQSWWFGGITWLGGQESALVLAGPAAENCTTEAVFYTADGGRTWKVSNNTGNRHSLCAATLGSIPGDGKTACLAHGFSIACTLDGGATWPIIDADAPYDFGNPCQCKDTTAGPRARVSVHNNFVVASALVYETPDFRCEAPPLQGLVGWFNNSAWQLMPFTNRLQYTIDGAATRDGAEACIIGPIQANYNLTSIVCTKNRGTSWESAALFEFQLTPFVGTCAGMYSHITFTDN
eukprot:TRINITY_DN8534_c0_g2_i2.p1 TRINITY_DN8534_c0_g2~~TRINITY_DN8534_c0_g2_i2.p1  ORF type:complete len:433 (+),score=36.15 TRINITY_DN8534_c0_g2_i2:229-1527(+)